MTQTTAFLTDPAGWCRWHLHGLRWSTRSKLRFYGTVLRYARGAHTEEDAYILLRDAQKRIGSWTLESIDADQVLESARERWEDHPALERLSREAAQRVHSKWESSGETTGVARDWALDLVAEYAKGESIELVTHPEEDPGYPDFLLADGDFMNYRASLEGWMIFDCDGSANGPYQICKIDDQDDEEGVQLESDDQAWKIVTSKAVGGSAYHLAALRYIRKNNVKEWIALGKAHPEIRGLVPASEDDVPLEAPFGPWAITDSSEAKAPGDKVAVIARFATQDDAEGFLATSATIDPDKLYAGHYGIDGPEDEFAPAGDL